MSVLFCHDHRFVQAADGRVLSTGQYDKTVLKRYEDVFGSVWIAGRSRPPKDEGGELSLSLVMDTPERFIPVSNLSSVNGLVRGPALAEPVLAPALNEVDAVIARLPSEIGLAALNLARRRGLPSAVEVVACVWDGLWGHGAPFARVYAPLAYLRMRRAVAEASHAVYVSRDFLQARYPNRRGVCEHVSNVQIPAPDDGCLEARLQHIHHRPTPSTLGMIAALFHKSKGIDVALKALAEARAERPDLTLRILGPGDPQPWLEEAARLKIEDAVTFCGVLPRGAPVLSWLDEIDVYVQTSFQEGLPRALIEAMSRAAPALASAAGGTPELLEPEKLHKPGDHGALARQILSGLDAGSLVTAAKRNFSVAAEYAKDVLDARRSRFWQDFRETAVARSGAG
ncbi:MAG: glycosyltransferase [Pseudomonadota bacterium]